MVETRRAPRYRVAKTAIIRTEKDAIDCTIRDLSTAGAVVQVESQIGIPENFLLSVPDDELHLHCQVVWRTQFRIGIAFD